MAVVLEDMPPLLWHAELGQSLPDAWTGEHQRGVQLHDLRDAVVTWRRRYGQRAWLRQLVGPAEDGGVTAADGGRRPAHHRPARRQAVPDHPRPGARLGQRPAAAQHRRRDRLLRRARGGHLHRDGLLPGDRPLNAYDPGSFWSGDDLELLQGAQLGPEIPVDVPLAD